MITKGETTSRVVVSDNLFALTKRELFAAMAMQGVCANPIHDAASDTIAAAAVLLADALIAELEKGETK